MSQRLHPLTPLLKGVRAFWVVIAALSWQGFARFGLQQGALIVAIGGAGALAYSFVAWRVSNFEVVDRELRIQEGLLVRRNRSVPLERMQSIEVIRPLLAQLTGLAELRIEVVGGDKSEARLAYLPVVDAERLRVELLALKRGPAAVPTPDAGEDHWDAGLPSGPGQEAGTGSDSDVGAGHPGTTPATGAAPSDGRTRAVEDEPAPEVLHQVALRDLAVSQALTWSALLSPFALAVPIVLFSFNPELSFVGIAGTVTAALGTLGTPIRRFLRFYNFTVAAVPEGLRISHGATETRHQTVPAERVQSVAVVRPLLWRSQGWVACELHVAGVRTGEGEAITGDTLLPVADPGTAWPILERALPGAAVAATMPLAPAPERARWRAPVRARTLGFGLTPELFVTRSGLFSPRVTVVPYTRIQAVSLEQGPWQRRLGLASVRVHTAGGSRVTADYRTVAEANWLAAELHARAAASRN
ncbi:PH domain-containing protein [Longispora sp. NPDC051575]|uniref:PH domain-containing protein n=1 Tax=Longispora sp. NPDC051575 TaxID=3154943 RepID=UPI003443C174